MALLSHYIIIIVGSAAAASAWENCEVARKSLKPVDVFFAPPLSQTAPKKR